MLVYSRTNTEKVWTGTVTEMDTSSADTENQNSNYYYGGNTDSALSSTNYAFYVTLSESDGLLLGEHVYLEKDDGQLEKRDGIWLDAAYLQSQDDAWYVWAESSRHSLEQRFVTLGEYDSLLDRYEITQGLSMEDYISYPMEYMKEGMAVTRVDYGVMEDDTEA